MITIKDAVVAAKEFVKRVYAESGEEISEIGLEEVDRTEDDRVWLITIGFTTTDKGRNRRAIQHNLEMLGGLSTLTREYKVVHIDADTGEPLTMKIRNI